MFVWIGNTGLQGGGEAPNEAKIRNGRVKQLYASKLRKMHVVFVSKTRGLPTEAVAASAASAIFRLLISTISPNL